MEIFVILLWVFFGEEGRFFPPNRVLVFRALFKMAIISQLLVQLKKKKKREKVKRIKQNQKTKGKRKEN